MKSGLFFSLLGLSAVAAGSDGRALAQEARQGDKPNILLFLVDDMGWQDTSVPFWHDTTELIGGIARRRWNGWRGMR